jgi:hypothetical protein
MLIKTLCPRGFSAKDRTKLYFFMGRPDKNTNYQYYRGKLIAPSGADLIPLSNIDNAFCARFCN